MSEQSLNIPTESKSGLPRARARFLTQSIQLEEANPPGLVRAAIFLCCGFLVFLCAWAAITEVDEIARAPGEIVPRGQSHKIQHFEGGIVEDLLVRNGQRVSAGEVLVNLLPHSTHSERAQVQARLIANALQHERLQALVADREPDFSPYSETHPRQVAEEHAAFVAQRNSYLQRREVIEQQILQRQQELAQQQNQVTALHEEIALLQEQAGIDDKIRDLGLVPKIDRLRRETKLAERQGALTQAKDGVAIINVSLTETKQRLLELQANWLSEIQLQDSQIRAQIAEIEKNLIRLDDRVQRLQIRAPVSGFIEDLQVSAIGSVIKPGQDILTIIPSDEALVVEARVSTTDIGHVHVGLPVDVKVNSYNAFRFGSIDGTVQRLSASTYLDEKEQPYYVAEVALAKNHVGDATHLQVIPGMTVAANIKTGKKTLLSYLVKPVSRGFSESFTER